MHSYTVSMRIESAKLDTSRVTQELGITPRQTRFAGQYRSPNSVFEEALWEFEVTAEQPDVAPENWPHWPQWKSLEKAFENLLSIFTPHAKLIQSYKHDHNVYIWVGHFSSSFDGGPRLSPEILKALGDFGVPDWVDTHFIEDARA
jgi:uncharacterized protein DUF4279